MSRPKISFTLKSEPIIERWLYAKRTSAAQVAESLGMSRQLFHLKRRGNIGFSQEEIEKLADIMGCEIEEIAESSQE